MEPQKTNLLSVDELGKQSREYFSKLIKEQKLKNVLDTMVNLVGYTVQNQVAAMMQNPKVKDINSRSAWEYHGRNIKEGEQSIKAIGAKLDSSESEIIKDGKVETQTKLSPSGYQIRHYFDIAQTQVVDKEKAAKYDAENDYTRLTKDFTICKQALESTLKGYTFKYEQLAGGVTGICDNNKKEITILAGMSEESTLKTLIEKITYARANILDRTKFQGLGTSDVRDIKKIESDCASYIVCSRLGLNTNDFQVPDTKEWNDYKVNRFLHNIEQARSISSSMLNSIEKQIEEKLVHAKIQDKKTVKSSEKEQVNEQN